MKRTLIVFVVCCICMSLAVPFVSASSTGTLGTVNDSNWFDLTSFLSSSYYPISSTDSIEISFGEAPISRYFLVDVLFYTDSSDFGFYTYTEYLDIVSITNNLYRAYGYMYTGSKHAKPYLYFSANNGSYLDILSVKVSLNDFSYYEIGYSYSIVNRSYSGTFTHSVGAGSVRGDLNMGISDPINVGDQSFYIRLSSSLDDIKKYDFLQFNLSLACSEISSIRCNQNNTSIDFSTNFFNPISNSNNATRYLQLTVDLSKIDLSSSYPLSIYIDGTIYEPASSPVYFNTAIGFLSLSDNSIQSWLSALFVNLRSWFSTQFSKLDQVISELKILNGRDSEAITAQQTQEEINVSVNNQLVGAVEDWNTNIEVVQTNYDMAFEKTTPALVWLSSLADGIFNGMGWFGNVYFLVGLISVIMLVLSKSGLAHKIGSISRRKGD